MYKLDVPEPESSPTPLEYAPPPEPRSFEEALLDHVQTEIRDGRLATASARHRLVSWLVLAVAMLLAIVTVVALSR